MKKISILLLTIYSIIILFSISLGLLFIIQYDRGGSEREIHEGTPYRTPPPQMMITTSVDNETNNVTFFFHAFDLIYPRSEVYFLNCSWEASIIRMEEEEMKVKFDHLGNISIEFWVVEEGIHRSENRTINLDLSRHDNILPIPASTDRTLTFEFDQQPVMLNGEGSYDQNGEIIGYYWDFGDGTHSDTSKGIRGFLPSKVVAHTYDKTGLYMAKLYVMDNDENISSHPYEIEIVIKSSYCCILMQ